jgi:hypothetical protein
MKKFLIPATIAAMAIPALASAATGDVTGSVAIDGSVAARCQFTTNLSTISLGELADGSTGLLDASKVTGNTNLVGWCNGTNSTMTALATSLKNTTSAPTGFSNQVDFAGTATANSHSTTDSDSTDVTASGAATVGIFTGNINVSIASGVTHGGATLKLVAGAYNGSVLVTLAPAL